MTRHRFTPAPGLVGCAVCGRRKRDHDCNASRVMSGPTGRPVTHYCIKTSIAHDRHDSGFGGWKWSDPT